MADESHRCAKELEEIPATVILNLIAGGDPVRFDHKIIKGDLDISKLGLQKEEDKFLVTSIIEIVDSRICGNVNFSKVSFKNDFDKRANFSRTIFNNHVSFYKACFCNGAEFDSSQFNKSVDFKNTRFYSSVFTKSQFKGYADFREAKFYSSTILDGIQFDNYANFVETRFKEIASFHWAIFNDYANFSKAEFREKAKFDRVRFGDDVDFRDAVFHYSLGLKESSFERFRASWEDIKDHLDFDKSIYLMLINNFKNLGQFRDADNCYYQYRKLEQKSKNWDLPSNKFIDLAAKIYAEIISYLGILHRDLKWVSSKCLPWIDLFNWSKLYDFISEISCGYGVKVLPVISWMIGLAFIFGFGYYAFTGIEETSEVTSTINTSNISMPLSIYFSIMTLIGKTPTSFAPIGAWKYIVMIEGFIGYLLMALLVFIIIRKLIR